jgi:hypothetical protein
VEEKRNIDIAKDFLQSKGLEFSMRPGSNTAIMLRSPDRVTLQKELEGELADLGFAWHPNAPSAGFGRFEILGDREKGNAYILMKNIGGGAKAGADYELKVQKQMKDLFSDIQSSVAGSGHGSDFTLKYGNKSLSIELKTKGGADFGEIPIGYDIGKGEWHTRKTKNFLKNEELFQGIFDDFIKEKTLNMKPIDLDLENYNIVDNSVVRLKRMEGTGDLKQKLQAKWFDGRTDLHIPVSEDKVQKYYSSKGDQLIQIRGRGLYALTEQASEYFDVPELKDKIRKTYVRVRIKPSHGRDSSHAFAGVLKVVLDRSSSDIQDQEIIDKIENYFR